MLNCGPHSLQMRHFPDATFTSFYERSCSIGTFLQRDTGAAEIGRLASNQSKYFCLYSTIGKITHSLHGYTETSSKLFCSALKLSPLLFHRENVEYPGKRAIPCKKPPQSTQFRSIFFETAADIRRHLLMRLQRTNG